MKEVLATELVSAVPVETPAPIKKMTRREKLMHLATIVREFGDSLFLEHSLEKWTPQNLAEYPTNRIGVTAFSLAMLDPTFREQGLKPSNPQKFGEVGSYADALGFLELTQSELHEFACNCGGAISNRDMAERIENIANRGGGASGATMIDSSAWTGRLISNFGFGI